MPLVIADSSPVRDPQDALEPRSILSAEYAAIALLSVAVWDTLLSGRLEYLSFWRAPSSILKWLYLATRYLGLAIGALLVVSFHIPAAHCNVAVKVTMSLITASEE
ncbi:hypothetical protein JCM11491_003890 [Sporobolomyces phaffii]